jgi:hypothetical protein
MVLVIIAPTVWLLAGAVRLDGPGPSWSWIDRDPIVDGWPIGAPDTCQPGEPCVELLELAARQLGRRDPDHAAVVRVDWHRWGRIVDDDGRVLIGRSGRWHVARFELADGSVRAIGVGFPGISDIPVAVDYGP